jgi:hypothetical protein
MNSSPHLIPEHGTEKRIIKHRKKRINNFEDTYHNLNRSDSRKELLAFDHTNPLFAKKKKKLKKSDIYMDMNEFYDNIENNINFDEVDYERSDLKKVYSADKVKNIDIDSYLRTARIFWNYRNLNIENELCADFFDELERFKQLNKAYMVDNKISLDEKVLYLKKFVRNGITLDNYFDEMALKVLHLTGYKKSVALYFLFKGLNPFIEGKDVITYIESEEGFRNDVEFFQKDILSILTDDEDNI